MSRVAERRGIAREPQRLRRDGVLESLFRPYRRLAVGGAVTAGVAGAVVLVFDLSPWVETLLAAVVLTGVICAAMIVVVPLRRWRQRRWARLAPRGSAPDWVVLVPRLERLRRVSWALVGISWILVATAARSSAAVTERYESLTERAERLPGEVSDVEQPAKGLDSMRVSFLFEGREHEVRIFDIPSRFAEGDEVVVLVDPADPERSTVEGVERSTDSDRVLQALAILCAFLCGSLGLLAARRASVAGDALLATGVRKSSAWWQQGDRGSCRLVPPHGAGPGIRIGQTMISTRSPQSGGDPIRVAGPERGPIVLLDRLGPIGTVRRPYLPRRDLRRLLNLER